MELFSIYQTVYMVFLLFRSYRSLEMRTYAGFFAIAGTIWLVLFVLQGLGLYRMAKNAGKTRKWMAFVPFLNLYYITRISGPCTVFGHTMRRSGLYAMIAQILIVLLQTVTVVVEMLLFTRYRSALVFDVEKNQISIAVEALPQWLRRFYSFYEFSYFFGGIANLVYIVLIFITTMGLYKSYAPKNFFLLTIISTFVPLSRFIIVFVLRNRTATDYEAYLRQAKETFYRTHAPYGSPYQNPYGSGAGTPPPPQPEPEPFEEFSGGASSEGSRSDEDDLFD